MDYEIYKSVREAKKHTHFKAFCSMNVRKDFFRSSISFCNDSTANSSFSIRSAETGAATLSVEASSGSAMFESPPSRWAMRDSSISFRQISIHIFLRKTMGSLFFLDAHKIKTFYSFR